MTNFSSISFTVDEGVGVLQLTKPETLNALTFDMMYEVQEVLARIEQEPTICCLILTGAGRGFCSGQDLRSRPAGDDVVGQIMDCYHKAFQGIRSCRVPVVAAVNGTAAGGGFSLALTADVIFAASTAKFIQVFSRIGLSPDLGSTYLLPRIIGRFRALEYIMSNDPISAQAAAEWGIVNRVYEPDELMAESLSFAKRLAKGPTRALVEARRLVDGNDEAAFEARFREEIEVNQELKTGFDAKEGPRAFLEQRAAQFQGT